MTRATVIADASFCSQTRAAGFAVWIRMDTMGEPIKHHGTFKTAPTNSTEAEVWAALNGVAIARSHGATDVLVQSDCTSVVIAMTSPETMRKITALPEAAEVLEGLRVQGRHVKGHTRGDTAARWVNNWCDTYAKLAMRKQRKSL